MPNVAFTDMLRPRRRNQSLAALCARGQLTKCMSSRTEASTEHVVLPCSVPSLSEGFLNMPLRKFDGFVALNDTFRAGKLSRPMPLQYSLHLRTASMASYTSSSSSRPVVGIVGITSDTPIGFGTVVFAGSCPLSLRARKRRCPRGIEFSRGSASAERRWRPRLCGYLRGVKTRAPRDERALAHARGSEPGLLVWGVSRPPRVEAYVGVLSELLTRLALPR
jgi:hypothetical protein